MISEGAFYGVLQSSQLNHVICEHFLRQGMLDIAENLIQVRSSSHTLIVTGYSKILDP